MYSLENTWISQFVEVVSLYLPCEFWDSHSGKHAQQELLPTESSH